jgi:hypothetical protein
MRGSKSWRESTGNLTIFADLVEVPYIGPVFLEAYARGEVSGTLGAGLGPGVLRGVELDLDPLGGFYRGTATLAIPADLRAKLALSGILGGAANWLCLLDLMRVEGGLTGSATGNFATEFTDTVEVVYKNGKFTANNTPRLDACVQLALGLGALLNVKLLGHPVATANWTLAEKPWDRCWRWPSSQGSGGGLGAGNALVANLGSLINGTAQPGFSAAELVASSFGTSAPVVALKPLPEQARDAKAKADKACNLTPAPAAAPAPGDCCPIKIERSSQFRVGRKGHRYRAKTITVKDSRGKHTRNAEGKSCDTQRLENVIGDDPADHGECLARWITAASAGDADYGGQMGSDSVGSYAEIAQEVIENGAEINKHRYWGHAGRVVGVDIRTKQVTENARIDGVPDEAHVIPQQDRPT